MLDKIYFQLTEEHVKLMRRFNIRWDDGYDGAPAVDCKRPFGNGDWENDVAEILGIEPIEHDDMEDTIIYPKGTSERIQKLYREMDKALAVVLSSASFTPGAYVAEEYRDNWEYFGDCDITELMINNT